MIRAATLSQIKAGPVKPFINAKTLRKAKKDAKDDILAF